MRTSIIAALAASLIGGAAAAQTAAAPLTEDRVRAIVEQVIAERPDLIISSLQDFESRQAQESKTAGLTEISAILANSDAPRLGDATASPAGVLFLDYNCGHCRRTHPEILSWLKDQPGRSLVVAELPVLGPGSVAAARAALAARASGDYQKVSDALYAHTGQITPENLPAILTGAGLDAQALISAGADPAIEKLLVKNMRTAGALGVTGTPALVIGDEVHVGAFTADDIDAMMSK